MSVYKPKRSPYYSYDFELYGVRFHGSTKCRSKREAEQFEKERRVEWRRAKPNAELVDYRWHDNRHTTASRFLRATGNLKLCQMLLRHEDIATTMKYAHASTDDLRAALNDVSESRKKPRKRGGKSQKHRKI
jgi:integrase